MNSNIKFVYPATVKDTVNTSTQFINMAVKPDTPAFANSNKYYGMLFRKYNYLYQIADNIDFSFTGTFSVSFWANFKEKAIVDEAYPAKIIFVLDDNTTLSGEVPLSMTNKATCTTYRFFKITRDANNLITITCDSVELASATSDSEFNLLNNSYIYLGTDNNFAIGYDVVIDDILIYEDITIDYLQSIPEDYFSLLKTNKCIYIKISDGTVWAMREVTDSSTGTTE